MNRSIKETELAEIIAVPEELSPVTYQYYKNLANRKIILNDQINQSTVETVILPLLDMDNDGTGSPIEILISSPGGSIFDGLVLCDVIDRLKSPTTITVLGYAYSMGSVILLAGKHNPNVTKRCYPFSTALFHSGEEYLRGALGAVKDAMAFRDKIEDMIKKYTIYNSDIKEDQYTAMERSEWYMTSADMLKYGIVDLIL